MKKSLLVALIALAPLAQAQAQDSLISESSKIYVYPDGSIGDWQAPESPQDLMYTQSLWLSGMNGSSLYNSTQTHSSNRTPGPISNDTNAMARYNRVWKITRSQVDSMQNGWYSTPPQAVLDWPAHGDTSFGEPYNLAPFVDVDADGQYDPANGDYPSIIGEEAVFFMFNDVDPTSTTNNMQLEVHGMIYRHRGGGVLDSTFLVDYKLINRSPITYTDTWVSSWADMDIGDHTDDLVGSDVQSNAVFAYNGQAPDHYFGHTLASAAMFVRKGPAAPIGNNVDDDRDGCPDGVRDNNGNCVSEDSVAGIREYLPMSVGHFYNNTGTSSLPELSSPQTINEERLLMMGFCKDATYLEINDSTTLWDQSIPSTTCGSSLPTSFAFSGGSYDTSGSAFPMAPLDWYESPADMGDKRLLLSSGPFTFSPGQEINYRIGFLWHLADSATSVQNGGYYQLLQKLRGTNTVVQNADTSGGGSGGGPFDLLELPQTDFNVFYNAAQRNWYIENRAHPLQLHLYSLQGKLIQRIPVDAAEQRAIRLDALPRGIYILADPQSGKTFKLLR